MKPINGVPIPEGLTRPPHVLRCKQCTHKMASARVIFHFGLVCEDCFKAAAKRLKERWTK